MHGVSRRSGVALLLVLFVMAACGMIVLATLDSQRVQYSALRNTIEYERARYLAEAALQHALARLEVNLASDKADQFDINWQRFSGAGGEYCAFLSEGPHGTIVISAIGRSGQFTQELQVTVKMGG